jgi:hypothetical protein
MYLVEILTRCSKIEERVARVYRTLAERFRSSTDEARLWRELALEEETHADILRREIRAFEEQDESGAFLPEYTARIEHAEHMLADLEQQVPGLQSLDAAATLALAVEQAELEDLYDDLVTHGYPAFKLICERIESTLSRTPASRIPGLPVRSQRGGSGEPTR